MTSTIISRETDKWGPYQPGVLKKGFYQRQISNNPPFRPSLDRPWISTSRPDQ
jgi:hypothetical protein